jgi:hypothetical protein
MTDMSKHARLGKLREAASGRLRALISGNPALLGVAGIGFSVSFQTIAHLARTHGLPGWPPLYPIGIDVGILALVIESRKAIDARRSDLVPRLLAWCLAGLTIYVNAHGAAVHDWLGRALHVVMPALWVVFLELTRWRKLAKRRDGQADRIPRARWLLSPWRTAGMKRRMVLHDVVSYPVACAREEARMAAISLMPAVWGGDWKRTAPPLLRHHLASGTLPADLALACSAASPGYIPATGELAEAWVTNAKATTVRARAKARQQERDADRQEDPQPDRQDRPSADRRKPVSDAVRKRAKVKRLLTVTPPLTIAEVVAKSGASESTVLRVKRELAERPKTLSAVR